MLLKEIRYKLLKRRNKNLVSLIKYLSNVSCWHEEENGDICFGKQEWNSSINKIINGKTFLKENVL
jgi:hypothetical protein